MVEAEIYKALGDPARLEIVQRLSQRQSCTIGELSADLGMSRQGARKQLQVLYNAHLVRIEPRGRQKEVTLDRQTLLKAMAFIARLEREWDSRLNTLKSFVENTESSE